jgi:ribonuclease HIII
VFQKNRLEEVAERSEFGEVIIDNFSELKLYSKYMQSREK